MEWTLLALDGQEFVVETAVPRGHCMMLSYFFCLQAHALHIYGPIPPPWLILKYVHGIFIKIQAFVVHSAFLLLV